MNGVEVVASWLTPAVLFCVLNVMIGTIFFRSSLKPPQQRNDQHSQQQQPHLVRVSSFLERVKAFNLSSYQFPQPDSAAHEEEEPHRLARNKPDAAPNAFNLSSYRSLQPEPPARGVEDPHHVARSNSYAMSNAMNLSNYQSPQSEPAAREQEDPHHVARSKPDLVANAFNFPSYQSQQPETAAREPHHAPDAVLNAINFASYQPEPEASEQEEPHHVARSNSEAVVKAAPAARALLKSASEKISMVREDEEERWRPATVKERTGGDEEVDEKADEFINNFRQQLKLQRMNSILRYDEMRNRGARR